ncbi:MAG: hypothetical protein PHI32_13005 [Dysgonamonadaceae bacterium]|nr:hypothetical protein [Dysgonamonadaceae bacterium]MDD4527912.1 hypothetical protein [Candidatus Margulisiibacteriota bacterium]
MTNITSGIHNDSGADWTAATAGGLSETELQTFLGGSSITNFNPSNDATGKFQSCTFTLDGVNFRINSNGTVQYEKAKELWINIADDGIAIDVDDTNGLSPDEVIAFNRILSTHSEVGDNGRKTGYMFRPKTLFQKMLYGISNQMNEMFMDILSMSTVLSNGTGLRGIMLLAKKGIKVGDKSVASMLGNSIATVALTQYGAMRDNDVSIASITIPGKDGSTGEIAEGDCETIRVTFTDGGFVDLNLKDTDLNFVVSTSADGKPQTMENIDIKMANHETILESPGTLFLIQQLLQQMKDAMQAIGAVGKVGGDVKTTAVQSFVRDMNG